MGPLGEGLLGNLTFGGAQRGRGMSRDDKRSEHGREQSLGGLCGAVKERPAMRWANSDEG